MFIKSELSYIFELVAILIDTLYNMKIYFFVLLILFSNKVFSQLDSAEVNQFINAQYPNEQKFISFSGKVSHFLGRPSPGEVENHFTLPPGGVELVS